MPTFMEQAKKNSSKLLEVIDLETHFHTEEGVVKAVNKINFTLYRGETIGIVGESGSGKSVTSLSIMQLIQSPPGKIVGGKILYYPENQASPIDLLTLNDKSMQQYRGNEIAMIFQEPMTSLNPVFKCGSQVIEAIMLHQKVNKAEAKQRTLELFERVKLPDPERIYNAYPHQISGGQKQRVMIAMALSCNPSILIADEPTTALDVTVQKRILELMDELKKKIQAAVIFITHDLGVIAEIADRVLVMFKGQIVEQGMVREIFTTPQHPYTKGLLACRPPLDYRMSKLPTVSDFMDIEYIDDHFKIKEKIIPKGSLIENFKVTPEATQQRLQQLQTQKPILEVKNLNTWFPMKKNFFGKPTAYLKAVDDVSFKVYPGETLGLVGESGCGKTTLGRTILRLIPAHSGEVIFNGHHLFELSDKALKNIRKEMQIIFQDPYASLNPRMTIGNAILEPMNVHRILDNRKQRIEKVMELLEIVNLEAKHFNRYPHEFSGGQRQRICIARALALNPKFIICDESVSALDVSVQAQVLNLLIRLREQFQFTYIFISHDLSVVKFISDRMIVMNKGKIEEIGTADEIYNHPQKAYTQKLISAIPNPTF